MKAPHIRLENLTLYSDESEGGIPFKPSILMEQSAEVNAAMIIANSLERLANVIEENLKPLKAVIEMAAKEEGS